jgi:hypothetical protein
MYQINKFNLPVFANWPHRVPPRHRDHRRCLAVERLEYRKLLAAQVFTSVPEHVRDSGEFAVVYSVVNDSGIQDSSTKTTGVSLRMHYDSSKIRPDTEAIIQSAFTGATIQDTEDLPNYDADASTDRFFNFLWFDFQANFPRDEALPLILFTAKFDPVEGFSDSVSVKFSGSPPLGFGLQTSITSIDFGTTNFHPIITSPASASVRENVSQAIQVIATDLNGDVITYAITGGADAAAFEIDPATGEVSFAIATDYANPSDSDANNIYDIQVSATDNFGGIATQDILINVTNAAWINFQNIYDVNARDGVTPIDALLIINELNRKTYFHPETNLLFPRRPEGLEYYFDVTGDGKITPLDALRVINFLNRQSAANGEGPSDFSTKSATGFASRDASSMHDGVAGHLPDEFALQCAASVKPGFYPQ